MSKNNLYGLYDVKDYEQCVFIGTIREISNFLNYSQSTLRSYLTRKKTGEYKLLAHKYELIKINENDDIEEETNTKKDIFMELIEIFRPPKIKFPIFDETEWKLKRIIK